MKKDKEFSPGDVINVNTGSSLDAIATEIDGYKEAIGFLSRNLGAARFRLHEKIEEAAPELVGWAYSYQHKTKKAILLHKE